MVIDASALAAMRSDEPEADRFEAKTDIDGSLGILIELGS